MYTIPDFILLYCRCLLPFIFISFVTLALVKMEFSLWAKPAVLERFMEKWRQHIVHVLGRCVQAVRDLRDRANLPFEDP